MKFAALHTLPSWVVTEFGLTNTGSLSEDEPARQETFGLSYFVYSVAAFSKAFPSSDAEWKAALTAYGDDTGNEADAEAADLFPASAYWKNEIAGGKSGAAVVSDVTDWEAVKGKLSFNLEVAAAALKQQAVVSDNRVIVIKE